LFDNTNFKICTMNNRRKFLLQSSLAATAFIAAKPFKVLANYSSTFNEGRYKLNSLTFVHTSGNDHNIVSKLKKITDKKSAFVLLDAGKTCSSGALQLNYDASHHSLNNGHINGYKIICKDNIRVGVIAVNANEHQSSNRINSLAAMLKQDENCSLVVCISQLGYKNNADDITLAGNSEHIDIIIGKQTLISPKCPFIAANKNKAEVIIQYTQDIEAAIGKIKVDLDQFGGKFNISFN
jgi:hypothetical protein